MSNAPVVCAPDDPNRCQRVGKQTQCVYKAMPGFTSCRIHHGANMARFEAKRQARAYQLGQWHARVIEHAEHEQVKSLRDEIGLARVLMENIVRICQTPIDLIAHHSKISDLLTKIEKLVTSCHRLEEKTGALIDKSAALRLAADFVEIIGDYVTDPDTLETIGNKFVDLIAKSGKDKDDE